MTPLRRVRMSDEEYQQAVATAKARGLTFSALVRELLRKAAKEKKRANTHPHVPNE